MAWATTVSSASSSPPAAEAIASPSAAAPVLHIPSPPSTPPHLPAAAATEEGCSCWLRWRLPPAGEGAASETLRRRLLALQPLTPRLSKKRNRSLLKDLAVSVVDAADDDGSTLTPCSKGRSSKQLDSAYNHNTNPEHVCRTKDGAPVVDVHVPAMCECGSVVVGVWYRNRPHYCRWFRHARYSALRLLLEQNRRKNKSRPYDDTGGCDAPGSAANDS